MVKLSGSGDEFARSLQVSGRKTDVPYERKRSELSKASQLYCPRRMQSFRALNRLSE